MYFRGISEPDREPQRNRYASAERKSKFTEAVAKSVTDGDLYFAMQSPANQRFYVPVAKGEHGQEEDGLLCVTHKFSKRWEDMPGKWERYDGGGNLVIKVHSDDSIVYEAERAIEQALYHTKLGRAVGRDALRDMAESICTTFGLVTDRESRSTFTVDTNAEKLAQDALRDLLTYAPESGYDERLGEIGADYDGVGFAQDAKEYDNLLNGASDGFGGTLPKDRLGKTLPLLSQPVFYAVLGSKDDGRSFQARLTALMKAVGLDEEDV